VHEPEANYRVKKKKEKRPNKGVERMR